jgi:hypothetical protein
MYYAPEFDQVFANHSEIRAFYKWVFFPRVIETSHLEYMNIWPLVYEAPEVLPTQIAVPSNVIQVEGEWVQQWTVRDRTPEEMPEPEDPPVDPEDPPVDPEPEEPVQSEPQTNP